MNTKVDAIRRASRKLVRELGIIQLDKSLIGPSAQHCHAIVEIGENPGITVSALAELLLLSVSATSRIVQTVVEQNLVTCIDGLDKREKSLRLSAKGIQELANIDKFSDKKVLGAFEYLTATEQELIVTAIQKYSQALEQSREVCQSTKILTLSTSRPLRKQIVAMVENSQKNEFNIPISDDMNACILKAEDHFHYNNSYNFWYAVDSQGSVIGCIGLKKIDNANAELKKFFVDKRFRGKGVAQKLILTLVKAAKKHAFQNIWLGTVNTLKAAQRFYTKCGFAQVEKNELPSGFDKNDLDTLFFCGHPDNVISNL